MVRATLQASLLRLRYRLHARARARLIVKAARMPGWRLPEEAAELVRLSFMLPANAVLVEVGSFLGSGAVLLAGARKLRGSGRVHCIDPFDASGDAFSAPIYRAIAGSDDRTLRDRFEENIRRLGLSREVSVHQGTAEAIGAHWSEPIDLLLLDGDHSPEGARAAFLRWTPFLKAGGIVALPNSSDRKYDEGHDGTRRLVLESVKPPEFCRIYCIGTTFFAGRAAASTAALSGPVP